MFVTNHVLVGSLLGLGLRDRPVAAFGAGVASHFVCDAVPHWGIKGDRPRFLKYAVVDGLVGLTVMSAITWKSPRAARGAVVAGMLGAAFPDVDKPIYLVSGRSPFPERVNEFHSKIQRESPHRLVPEIAFGVAVLSGLMVWRRLHG